MNKKVLIISPFFPPTNAADMHRIRTSLPYFGQFGWDAEVVCVAEQYSDMVQDPLLLESIPQSVPVHKITAISKTITSRVGLGSLALRSMWHYRTAVNQLLKNTKYDLIYFSTTQFPLCVLGSYWKKKFGIPYVIDMQDPWHSDYYQDKPRAQQPKKYWFSYRLNKFLEPIALKTVDGLISVSETYIKTLKTRYPKIASIPAATIPFGAYEPDLHTAVHQAKFPSYVDPDFINIVYIGRGGSDMEPAIQTLFSAFKKFKESAPRLADRIKFYFLGTSYAPAGTGLKTVSPLAIHSGIVEHVVEMTDRIGYFQAIATLLEADALFMPGSDDPSYTASKLYPYLLTAKPLLALFNARSPALMTLAEYEAPFAFSYDHTPDILSRITSFLHAVTEGNIGSSSYSEEAKRKYDAKNMTRLQCALFEKVLQC